MLNQYFNHFGQSNEQSLVENLILESIKVYGHEVHYLPRTIVNEDLLYGEDVLSTFNNAASVEMYVKNVDGFEGEGTFLSKFGLEIRDQITFTVARKRFDQIRTEKLMTEVGYNLLLETADDGPSRQFLTSSNYETSALELEDGNGDNYSISDNRPQEGALIYFPLVDKIFEIKFVEHEDIFYQTGRLQTYDLICELFEYSSERINTGNTSLDIFEDDYSHDITDDQVLLESGDALLTEDGGYIILEVKLQETDAAANNETFDSNKNEIIDFSERKPIWTDGEINTLY